jgi:hypothetical protein
MRRMRNWSRVAVQAVFLPASRILLIVVLTLAGAASLFLVYPRIDQIAWRIGTVVAVIVCMTVPVLLVPSDLHKRWAAFVRTLLAVAGVVGLALQLIGDGDGGASSARNSTSTIATMSTTIPPDPLIVVEPTSAPIGSSFLVKGTHFAPNKIVRIDMGEYIVVERVRAGGKW